MPVVMSNLEEDWGSNKETVVTISTENSAQACVSKLIEDRIATAESAFIVCNLGSVVQQVIRWRNLLPRVRPFYAIKCNPDAQIVSLLASLGVGFDCASRREIAIALEHLPGRQQTHSPIENANHVAQNIVYANPFKFKKDMTYACRQGVQWTTFDTESELVRIHAEWPSAGLVLRISPTRKYKAVCQLGEKFGADAHEVESLLLKVKEFGMRLVGVSFHVGSGCKEMSAWAETIAYSAQIFDLARAMGFSPYLLDLGGGFPGVSDIYSPAQIHVQRRFEEACGSIRDALDQYFPEGDANIPGLTIIAEPGRYFAAGAYTLATQVLGKRILHLTPPEGLEDSVQTSDWALESDSGSDSEQGPDHSCESDVDDASTARGRRVRLDTCVDHGFRYVINDGIYGSFNSIMYDHATPFPVCVYPANGGINQDWDMDLRYPSRVYGPTCDNIDCVLQNHSLPELSVGDWLVWPDMGAYTSAASTEFNGIPRSKVVAYFVQADTAAQLSDLRAMYQHPVLTPADPIHHILQDSVTLEHSAVAVMG